LLDQQNMISLQYNKMEHFSVGKHQLLDLAIVLVGIQVLHVLLVNYPDIC